MRASIVSKEQVGPSPLMRRQERGAQLVATASRVAQPPLHVQKVSMVPMLELLPAETARPASPDTIAMVIARLMRRVSVLQAITAQEAPSHTIHLIQSMEILLD